MKKVEWIKNPSLNEIYSGGLQMALVSPADEASCYKQATAFVTCKDFFQDAVQAVHLNEKRSIYRFSYDPATAAPLSFDRFRICIGNNLDKDFAAKIDSVLDFINQFEKRIHLVRTTAEQCEPTPDKWSKTGGVWMFEGSGRWMTAPPMISLYTLLLRCGFAHTKGDDFDKTSRGIIDGSIKVIGSKGDRHSGCYDDSYLKDGQLGIKAILDHGYVRLFYKEAKSNFPSKINVSTMHELCGIVGFSQNKVKDIMPHWYRLMGKKPKKKEPVAK